MQQHRRSTAKSPQPPEGALLRVVPSGDAWAEGLPPVPAGFSVTVSFSSEESAALHGDALALLGYTTVGVAVDDREFADFLVPQGLLEARTQWWRALASHAERAFSMAHGPSQTLLASVLATHARQSRAGGASRRERRVGDGQTPSS